MLRLDDHLISAAVSPFSRSRSDDFMCTVCFQDLSSGAFKLEEHPVVPGVAVCPR